jgi:small subunit ribosomal protein S20
MPNIKAAEKWARGSEKRAARNNETKSRLRTLYKRAVAENDPAVAKSVESAFDKAANKGIIHPNKAARKKSRLAAAMRKAAAAPAKPAKAKTAKTATKAKKTSK